MPVYKDKKRGTWYVSAKYKDWSGEWKREFKRGFAKKGDAQAYERDFKDKLAGTCNMRFSAFLDLYYDDMGKRLRPSTMATKKNIISTHVLPYFKDKPINEIKAADIRKWQSAIMDEEYRPTYLRTINNQLAAVLNYAVRYYDLPFNPCRKAGSMGSKKAETIDFWTLDEYRQFIPHIANKPRAYTGLEILYWGGLRIGELLALTPPDFLEDKMALSITKTWQVIDGEEHIGPPKTDAGERVVPIPRFVGEQLKKYMSMLYKCPDDERIFEGVTDAFFAKEIDRGAAAAGVKRIRVHDVRHSHVSLLIHLGYDYLMIAKRIGHSDIKYIIETYGHLYPEDHAQLVKHLETLEFSEKV